ncbi:hypothetical protein GW17_00019097 [Ensete ventricosum]|nr:hypothetical protein GW17_00019097 [Ensete ventricosum]
MLAATWIFDVLRPDAEFATTILARWMRGRGDVSLELAGMVMNVQGKYYFPGYYSMQEIKEDARSSWSWYFQDKKFSEHLYNNHVPRLVDGCPEHDKGMIRRTMLEHEAIFRKQVKILKFSRTPSAVDFGRRRSIKGAIDRRRSTEEEKGKRKKKKKKKKRKRRKKKKYLARVPSPPAGRQVTFLPAWGDGTSPVWGERSRRPVCTGPTGYDTRTACYREVPWVCPHGNEATPHLTTREQGYASSYRTGMRRRLVSPRENEAPPCLPAGGRGDASSFDEWMRHRLVFQLANEAPPRLPAGTRRHEVSTAI